MRSLEISLPATAARKLKRSGKSLPLGKDVPQGDFAWVPPGSIVRINSSDVPFSVAVGSMKYGGGGWSLPVISTADVRCWRKESGFEPRFS
jgi:hypothetical protein